MAKNLAADGALSVGSFARIHRVSRLLTQREMAAMAGVAKEDVESFENNQPINPIVRLQLIKTVELIKALPFPRCC